MKFLHTSDLHIGKRLHEQSLIDEQRYMLLEIIKAVHEQSIQAVLISGDVYDRSVPPLDAVNLFDDFITKLTEFGMTVFIIAGNHDSADRLDFGARIMSRHNVYISGKELKSVLMTDEYGEINIWLLPYLRSQAALEALESANIDANGRNVILAHQFVIAGGAGPEPGGSEIAVVGGVDAIDASYFDPFDYVALGHIHRPQNIGRPTARYSGSPYPYSFDECGTEKSVVIVDIREKGDLSMEFMPIIPMRDLYRLNCTFSELPNQAAPKDSYVEITLTDDEPVIDAIAKVREIYPNTLKLMIDSKYSRSGSVIHRLESGDIQNKTPIELFAGFFEEMNGTEMNETQNELVRHAMEGGADDEAH